ncbi:MAG: dihydrofolate reductase family protein [Thermoleophilaceae bacterium]
MGAAPGLSRYEELEPAHPSVARRLHRGAEWRAGLGQRRPEPCSGTSSTASGPWTASCTGAGCTRAWRSTGRQRTPTRRATTSTSSSLASGRTPPKIVFSRSLDHADWNTRVVSADIGAEITRLKRQPGGGLVLFGGADIASSLMKLDLIDEFHLFVHPVVLGGGTALFGVDERVDLQLVEARTFEPGAAAEWAGAGSSSSSTVVELHYKRPTPPRAALLTSLLT